MTDGQKVKLIGAWIGVRVGMLAAAVLLAKGAWFVILRAI